uniref:Titin-like n=1 Tax=Scleropages formosus TaxID=113540 RepID=A0A8C9RLR6_SCLFO
MRWMKILSKKPITEPTYTVTNLTEGCLYEFHVMATNDAGIGPASNASALIKCSTPTSTPSAPTVLKATDSTKTSVSLEWTTPVFSGGMEITGYIIEMCKVNSQEWQKINVENCTKTKYTATGLDSNEEYKFRVCAVNGVGKGEACEILEPVRTVDRLASPEIDIDASFKQTHIVRNGGTVRLYAAFKGKPPPVATWTKADGDFSVMVDINTTEDYSTLIIENSNRYDSGKYILSLENSSGSQSITFNVKVLDTPGPPGPIKFTDVTKGALTLMWNAPVNDGGAHIQNYIVEKREASRRTWQEVSSKCTHETLRVTELLEGMPYFFRVLAENQFGRGEAYEMSDPVIATAEPAPPKTLNIVDTTNSTATLAWLKPEHDGGSRITGYMVETKVKGSEKWVASGHTKNLSMVLEGLQENMEYEFRVKAKNDAGYSKPRDASSSVIIKEPHIEPTADLSGITNQLITCKSGSTFTVDVPISGRPAPKVTWKLEEMRLKDTERVSIKTSKNRTTLSVKDCMRGDGGKYFLILENITGSKTFTITVNVIGRPSAPSGPIQVSSISSESCVLTWEAPEDDGGTEITNYIVEKRESGSGAWQLVNSSVRHTTIRVTHLTKYMHYTFRVSAENRFGVSKPSESETIVAEHPFGEFISVTANTISICWEEPYNDGGSKVTGYWIEKKERNTILWVRDNKIPCFEYTNFTVTGLGEGEVYEFHVIAKNANGIYSMPSESTGPVTCRAEYCKIFYFITCIDFNYNWQLVNNVLFLLFLKPLEDGGDPVSHYIVERRDTNRLNWVTMEAECKTLSCVIAMIKNSEYIFRVRGVNKYGPGVPLQSEPVVARNTFSKHDTICNYI